MAHAGDHEEFVISENAECEALLCTLHEQRCDECQRVFCEGCSPIGMKMAGRRNYSWLARFHICPYALSTGSKCVLRRGALRRTDEETEDRR